MNDNSSSKKPIFWSCLATQTWMALKENPKNLKNPDKVCRSLFDRLSTHKLFISLPDKQQNLEKFIELLKLRLLPEGQLQDAPFLKFITQNLKEQSKDSLVEFFQTVADGVVDDRKITPQEKECLYILGEQYNISHDQIENLLNKGKTTKAKGGAHHTGERILNRSEKVAGGAALVVALLIFSFIGVIGWEYLQARQQLQPERVVHALEQRQRLVFKQIEFKKYVVFGKPQGVDEHFEKLYIYLLTGSADIQFDMSGLRVNEEKTDQITRTLHFDYHNQNSDLPIEVDVNIPQTGIRKIEELSAKELSEVIADNVAKAAAVPAGLLGVYAGGQVGNLLGSVIKLPMPGLGRFAGGALGAAGGGVAAAGLTYTWTKNFVHGVKLSENLMSEPDMIISTAKPLIALELMGGNDLSADGWQGKVKERYQEDFTKAMTKFFRKLGWNEVVIDFS